MRVLKIIFRKTNRKHPEPSDIYCQCSDVECDHTFVTNQSFSHTLSPARAGNDLLKKKLIGLITPEERQMALDLLQAR